MDGQIASIISRVLASEQRAREAELRAERAESRVAVQTSAAVFYRRRLEENDRRRREAQLLAYRAEERARIAEGQVHQVKHLADQAWDLCEEIDRSGDHVRAEHWVCANGEQGRTSIPREVQNLMADIQRIDEEEEDSSSAAPDDDGEWSVVAAEEAEDTDEP